MTRTTTSGSCAGFTLIEMMAVMLIVSMMASLVVTMIPGTGRGKLKALTLQTAALLRRERLAAVLTGQSRFVSLDGSARTLVGQSGAIAIPRDVVVDVIGVDERWSGRRAVVRFAPDGASTGAVLKFSWENVRYEVDVNWYNGRVAVDIP
ncbi:prepilin-type N-terminal cleavage/methylation domain-containing protein [Bradyrhizobium tropiciagri]|uniref:prepilin-type N-terminal cleavage/methylation domain-containing protein n=1 Tax=Bradyrhizobium tropiciagri TaxID=312253 RepID=UPI001BA89CB7|nr:prepilin-type N-terminal cleavage/methylation domain-containing protein [Bradyrhizobium tropiciagri]MBR0871357.1 prepilin-type N-terminal cleavage/methylation domain-containing protein [Bradyrhizobium tropiciagri]